MSKPTLATIKRFVKANRAALQIMVKSQFDGMVDGCVWNQAARFAPVREPAGGGHTNQLRIEGAWFVFGSRDHFSEYSDGEFVGFRVSNCCGSFVLAVPAAKAAA